MRAMMSHVGSSLLGIGKFVLMTTAFCAGSIIAISGPPTPTEMARLSNAAGRLLRSADGDALRFSSALCRHLPVAAHAAGLCDDHPSEAEQPARSTASPQVVAVAQTASPAQQEILPPDRLDQISAPAPQQSVLFGDEPPASRAVHIARSRAQPERAHVRAHERTVAHSRLASMRSRHAVTPARSNTRPRSATRHAAPVSAHATAPQRRQPETIPAVTHPHLAPPHVRVPVSPAAAEPHSAPPPASAAPVEEPPTNDAGAPPLDDGPTQKDDAPPDDQPDFDGKT